MRPAIIPSIRYEDAPAAILFLCDAFGFLPHAIYPDEEDEQIIHHAQLVLDGNMLMLGSALPGEAQERYGWVTPEEAGGVTSSLYVVVEDVDGHCERARANGATIIDEPHENDGYPGRGYAARDPEGHVWSFGSYDPFAPIEDA
ncbi:VOC family protein [Sphingomonas oryzagri]|uniref:VOC family protein n=1 Tax=Sphingomonas oryzagri TaxID=3042314 RepID=A0ABT6N497_9SPHN|nr:VOC family protein [Sphingomonas oryzagri]MDH7640109.1 VOC family protein [Sphingomonas oryzagri]